MARAKVLLNSLEQSNSVELDKLKIVENTNDDNMIETRKLINTIKSLEINTLTPLEALSILNDLKGMVK